MRIVAISNRFALLVFGLFALLSAVRDAVSEAVFFRPAPALGVGPIELLFYFAVIAELAYLLFLIPQASLSRRGAKWGNVWFDLLLLNVSTLISFSLFFVAVYLPFGAGLNAFVFHGTSPIFTALVGAYILKERLSARFWLSGVFGILGVCAFAYNRISIDIAASSMWFLGLAACLVSSFFAAIYRVYSKRLLQVGLRETEILVVRLLGVVTICGMWIVTSGSWTPMSVDNWMWIVFLGLAGFAFPLYLSVSVLKRIRIRFYALLFFLLPIFTYSLSAALGNTRLFALDLLGAVLVLGAIAASEEMEILRKRSTARLE